MACRPDAAKRLFRLEQRGDLALGLDVGRNSTGSGLGRRFPGRSGLGGRCLVRLIEERVAWRRRRPVLALRPRRALAGRIEHVARIAHLTGFAPGTAAVVDAAARPVFFELQGLELDLAFEQLLD